MTIPALASYHDRMMNIAESYPDHMSERYSNPRHPYQYGHRDARHAAAEIANEADAKIAELEAALTRGGGEDDDYTV